MKGVDGEACVSELTCAVLPSLLPCPAANTTPPAELRRVLVDPLQRYIRRARPTGRELRSGTYGSVIELESAGEVVTGKVFRNISRAHMQAVLDKLYGEIILMMTIHHHNIVASRGVCFLEHPMPVLLMERLMSSLHAYLLDPSHHAMQFTAKVSILSDVASGLSYLHNHTPAVIHRDLTAKNVLLDSTLRAKIGDFGNARLMDLDPMTSPETFTSVPGTLEYMPPEAYGQHAHYDPSLDVVELIGRKYSMFGPLLLNDTTGAVTEAIEGQCQRNAAEINVRILRRWINGGGIQPVTWSTLTNVLREVGLAELAKDIEQNTQKTV